MKRFTLFVFAMFCSTASFAQNETGDWKLTCEESGCRMSQSLVSQDSGIAVLLVRVFGPDAPTALLTTPLGVFLKPGIVIKVDGGRARAYGFEICDPAGCHAGLNLDEALLRDFRRGNTAEITFFDGSQEQVTLPVSLKGFTAGYKALASAQ